jgi:hypothetical protein
MLAALSLLLLLTGCAASSSAAQPGPSAPPEPSPAAPAPTRTSTTGATFAVVGDSLTAVSVTDFADREVNPTSWVNRLLGSQLDFVGGWARPGALTETMAEEVEVERPDVLIIMGGTNDVIHGVPTSTTERNITAIVDKVIPENVVISLIPPVDSLPGRADDLNVSLKRLAVDNGWDWVDPYATLRDGERFAAGATVDGVHPTADGQKVIGTTIRTEVLTLLGLDGAII